MRVSVCAYPGARAGEGDPAAPRAPVLTGGFSVWLTLACGVCSVAFCGLAPGAQRRRRHSGAMADSARGRPDRAGRGRGRRQSGAAEFRHGHVRPTLIPPGCLLTSDCRGSVRRQRISRHVCRKFWPKRLGMVRRSGPGLPCPLAPVWPKAIAQPGANGPGLRALAFRLWRMALALLPLPSPPLPSSSFSPGASGCPGVQVSRCPGVQAQATPPWLRAADATDAPGA